MSAFQGGARPLDPPVESARARAAWTVGLLGFCIALSAADLVQESLRLVQLNRVAGSCLARLAAGCQVVGSSASLSALRQLDARTQALLLADVISVVVTGIFWVTWQYRVQTLLRDRLGTPGLGASPRWAAGCWFVPFVNLVVPAQVTAEQWRSSLGSDGTVRPWRDRRLPAFLRWWWAFWLARLVANAISRGTADSTSNSIPTLRANTIALIAASAATVAAGVLAMKVVRSIQGRLEVASPYFVPLPAASATGLPWQGPVRGGLSPQVPSEPSTVGGAGQSWPPPPPGPAQAPWPVPGASSAPASSQPAPAGRPVERTPAGGSTRTLAWVVGGAAVAFALVLGLTSPSIETTGDVAGDAGPSASVIPEFTPPESWQVHRDSGATFTIAAPPEWEERPGGGLLLLSAPTSGIGNLVLDVEDEILEADIPLEQYVAIALERLHDPQAPPIVGEPRTQPVALPAGPAEIVRYHARLDDGTEIAFVQYVLIRSRNAWVLTFVSPIEQESSADPLFAQVSSTFAVTA